MATVAEIQNAKDVPDAVRRIRSVEGSGQAIALSGVWRIWPEHGGDNSHIQQSGAGSPFEGPSPTNPPHVFEIHPILKIEQQDLSGTLKPIAGFTPKDAEDAFTRYERGTFEITPKGDRVRMHMRMVGFNYVKFLMKVRKRFHREEDGEFISAQIYSPEEELLVHDRRIGFVAGTEPDEKQKTVKAGECIIVLGIPRIDLALVSWRTSNAIQVVARAAVCDGVTSRVLSRLPPSFSAKAASTNVLRGLLVVSGEVVDTKRWTVSCVDTLKLKNVALDLPDSFGTRSSRQKVWAAAASICGR